MMPFNDFFHPHDHFPNLPETEVETLPENDNGMLTRIVHEEFLKIWTACREDNFVTFDTLTGLICEKKKKSIWFESFFRVKNLVLSFYRSQNVLCRAVQIFCARPKIELYIFSR